MKYNSLTQKKFLKMDEENMYYASGDFSLKGAIRPSILKRTFPKLKENEWIFFCGLHWNICPEDLEKALSRMTNQLWIDRAKKYWKGLN